MGTVELMEIPTCDGPLAGVVHLPVRTPASVVVCCHGMLSSKDSAKFVRLGEELCRGGLAAVRFDFCGCGESRATPGDSLIAGRMRDLDAVIDYVLHQPWANGTLGLLGSSFGGYVALLTAGLAPSKFRAVVCWATPFHLERIQLALEESEALKKRFPPGFGLGIPSALNGLPPIPGVLVVHGRQDETVSWKDALEIYEHAADPKRMIIMENAEHRLLDPPCRELAFRLSLDWFHEQGL